MMEKLFELFSDSSAVDKMLSFQWDYKDFDEYIDKKRVQSLNFLKEACGD